MAFSLFKGIFKQVRILSTKDSYLAQTVRTNLRIHYNHYQKQLQTPRKKEYKQKNDELLKSFHQFLIQSNQQSSQFSQKAKMKLVELVCNINKFVNHSFQIRKDILSLQMQILENCKQFKRLKDGKQKDFVRGVLKKTFYGQETYDYTNLTDFFKDHRFQTCHRGSHNFEKVNPQTKRYIQRIIKGEQIICPYFKRIYEYYFTDIQKKQLAFESYLNCRYILIDFDDMEQQWETNTHQAEKAKQIHASKTKIVATTTRQNQRYKYQQRKRAQQELNERKNNQKEQKPKQNSIQRQRNIFFKDKK